MNNSSLTLYLEINDFNFIFFVTENNVDNDFKVNYKLITPLGGIENNRVSDLKKISETIRENIFLIEKKFNHTFKEIILILENFDPKFINFTGFKKLNGSQIIRENITYILNTLKSCVDKTETKLNILHIFNSNYKLDKKKIDNLPIGLFGDFYSHELSFNLINKNDLKNLKNIFNDCNLKIKKIFLKSFIAGANISNNYLNTNTFFKIKIKQDISKIFYFENDSLKYEQSFKFGSNIIIKDILKITLLKKDIIEIMLNEITLDKNISENELIGENFFKDLPYRKIKKKLIYDISLARIEEILDVIIFKNINIDFYNKQSKFVFFEIENELHSKGLKAVFKETFQSNNYEVKFLDKFSDEKLLKTVNKLVHFGWKKEAIPTSHPKKSLLARFFEAVFD